MTRGLTAAVVTEIQSNSIRPVYFVEIGWGSGTTNIWTGHGTFIWDSKSWIGAGQLLGVSAITESTDMRATGVQITLTGIDSTLLALALTNARQGKPCSVWIGFRDSAGAIIADPPKLFGGRVDAVNISEGPDSASISVRAESLMIQLNRSKVRRYSPETHKGRYPGDTFFDFAAGAQQWSGEWGAPGNQTVGHRQVLPGSASAANESNNQNVNNNNSL